MKTPAVLILTLLVLLSCKNGSGDSPEDIINQRAQTEKIVWSEAVNTFVLPVSGQSYIYEKDVQAGYPEIDWLTLDRLYIPAGIYNYLFLGNLPVRDPHRPLIITNYGGQVHIASTGPEDGHTYIVELQGGSGWVFTGMYSDEFDTGHTGFTGHANGQYDGSSGRYGIWIHDHRGSGIKVRGGANNFELSYVEIGNVGFAGLLIKTDNDPAADMCDVSIHDLYIHDTESEGMYLGNSVKDGDTQHKFVRLKVFNNRVLRCGTEGLQLNHMGDGSEIHHNVVLLSATLWKDPFQIWQDGGIQYYVRSGSSAFRDNIVIGGASGLFNVQFIAGSTETLLGGQDTLSVGNNWFSHSRRWLGYIHNPVSNTSTTLDFHDNHISAVDYHYNEIDSSIQPLEDTGPGYLFAAKNNKENPQIYRNNTIDAGQTLLDWVADNGSNGNVTQTGNLRASLDPPQFLDDGMPPDTDWHDVERWVGYSGYYGIPVTYSPGDVVIHDMAYYRCLAEVTYTAEESGSDEPQNAGSVWEYICGTADHDDVRLAPGSPYAGMGLTD
jgi:hypothetical protein